MRAQDIVPFVDSTADFRRLSGLCGPADASLPQSAAACENRQRSSGLRQPAGRKIQPVSMLRRPPQRRRGRQQPQLQWEIKK